MKGKKDEDIPTADKDAKRSLKKKWKKSEVRGRKP